MPVPFSLMPVPFSLFFRFVPFSLFLAFGKQILGPVAIPFAINLFASTAVTLIKFGLWKLPLPVLDLTLVLMSSSGP